MAMSDSTPTAIEMHLAEKVAEAQRDMIAALDLVARIRHAVGDHGERMQDELIAYCKELRLCYELKHRKRPKKAKPK